MTDLRLPPIFHRTQASADALVAEALEDPRFRPLIDVSKTGNALRLILGMWYVSGSTVFPRGWVRAGMVACIRSDAPCPNATCWRWFRSKLIDSPAYFFGVRGLHRELLVQLEEDVAVM